MIPQRNGSTQEIALGRLGCEGKVLRADGQRRGRSGDHQPVRALLRCSCFRLGRSFPNSRHSEALKTRYVATLGNIVRRRCEELHSCLHTSTRWISVSRNMCLTSLVTIATGVTHVSTRLDLQEIRRKIPWLVTAAAPGKECASFRSCIRSKDELVFLPATEWTGFPVQFLSDRPDTPYLFAHTALLLWY